jgi:hypothetical protein
MQWFKKHFESQYFNQGYIKHFEWLQHVSCDDIQCVGIALENTIVTTIGTNSYNISDFELQALQQYSYNILDLELQAVSYTSR